MAVARKARDTDFFKDTQGPRQASKKRMAKARRGAVRDFDGKKFSDLATEEKDDLLKRLAIMAGLVEE